VNRSFAVSSVVHLAFLTVIIAPAFNRLSLPSADVINVKLVAEQRKVSKPVAKPAAPKQEQVVEKKEPDKSKMAYKPETPKPKPKKTVPKEKPKTESKPPARKPEPAESAPAETRAGSPAKVGSGSKVRVDDEDFKFAYYLEIIKERISGNWSPPPTGGSPEGVMSTVYFKISRDGKVSDIEIEDSSKFDLFDRSATRAVSLSSPLPPLPAGFKGNWLGVHFEFEQKSG
jgi:TonB family protein